MTIFQPTRWSNRRRLALEDRRVAARYAIRLALRYRAAGEDHTLRIGRGETLDISRRAVRFTSYTPLPVGARVELSIEWPSAKSDQRLLLKTRGKIIRSDLTDVVATIGRYTLMSPSHQVLLAEMPS